MSLRRFLFKKLSGRLSGKHIYLTRSLTFRTTPRLLPPNADYIRYSTLELVFEEIISNQVQGSVAEVGVYKGDFAKRLNHLFKDRKLYLFDTFEGFSPKDVDIEVKNGFSSGNQDFSDTSVELVREKMSFPENCIFKKGMFPETAKDVEDVFCFVSLDTDLYQPIYEGLKFFYPKLVPGGYIFVHDFNNDQYKGVKQAVVEFCKQTRIGYVPVPDSGGSVIICK